MGLSKMIPLNTIQCRECLEGMREIPEKSVDLILCDLPYNVTANIHWDKTKIDLNQLWVEYDRISKNNIRNNQNKGECNRMAKQIELETVLRGEEARAFNEYVNAPVQTFTSESRALFREARQLSRKMP